MEIGNRQKFGLAGGEPLRPRCALTLRTMAITAGIIGDPRHAAVVARLDVTAERGVAMPTQNVSDLKANANARPVPRHGRSTGRRDFQG